MHVMLCVVKSMFVLLGSAHLKQSDSLAEDVQTADETGFTVQVGQIPSDR